MEKQSIVGAESIGKGAVTTQTRPQLHGFIGRYHCPMLSIVLFVSDALMITLGFRLAYFVRFELSLSVFKLEALSKPLYYSSLFTLLLLAWLIIFAASGLYQKQNLLGGTREYELVFRAITIGLLLVVMAGFLEPDLIIARGWLLMAWVFTFLFCSGSRFWIRRVVYGLRTKGLFTSPAIIVGRNPEAEIIVEQLQGTKTSGFQLLGVVDGGTVSSDESFHELPVLGSLDQLESIVEDLGVEEIVISTSALSREQMLKIFERFGVSDTVKIRMSSGLFEMVTTGLHLKEVGLIPLVSVNQVQLTGTDKALKFILDYGITIPGIIFLSPILLLIGIAVKLDSPGPSMHRRRVMGLRGKEFYALKFRTMYSNGDEILDKHPGFREELASNHKLKKDPRVTRIGKILRRYSIDEFPQLFNVLKGDMSLVGPRMIAPQEIPKYNKWGINLLTVRPGITGLWQVSGRSDITYEERVRLDMYFIRNWSIWLDLQLLVRTIPAVLGKRGAY